ncbi:hypothetical protein F5X96DRAFT_667233 [Biscogniauxia mediterranea]|nr:hypothetical protein F5X96DRAFT_667233 [Biscogniauxia mediterranea]
MPTATDGFLAPRGLLVDKKFCCRTVAFADIHNALQSTEKLPYTDQSLQTVGFTDTGTCVKDIIFDGLAELYKDPDNESPHRQIDQNIKDRVETLRKISNVAAAVKTNMTSAVQTIIENQAKLEDMAKPLQDSSTISKLLRESDFDDEDYQQDFEALQSLLKIIADQKMEDQSGPTLGDLEKLLGGAVEILGNMILLQEGFEEDARPGPDLVLNIVVVTMGTWDS